MPRKTKAEDASSAHARWHINIVKRFASVAMSSSDSRNADAALMLTSNPCSCVCVCVCMYVSVSMLSWQGKRRRKRTTSNINRLIDRRQTAQASNGHSDDDSNNQLPYFISILCFVLALLRYFFGSLLLWYAKTIMTRYFYWPRYGSSATKSKVQIHTSEKRPKQYIEWTLPDRSTLTKNRIYVDLYRFTEAIASETSRNRKLGIRCCC